MKTYEDGLNEAWEYARKIISADKCNEESQQKAYEERCKHDIAMITGTNI